MNNIIVAKNVQPLEIVVNFGRIFFFRIIIKNRFKVHPGGARNQTNYTHTRSGNVETT